MQLEKHFSEKLMSQIFNAVFVGMYLHYEPFGSFMEQFRANTEKVMKMLNGIKDEIVKHGGKQ